MILFQRIKKKNKIAHTESRNGSDKTQQGVFMPLIFLLREVIKALQVIFSSLRTSPGSSMAPKWSQWCFCPWVQLDLLGEVGSLEGMMLQNAFGIDGNGCSPAGLCHPAVP